MTEQPMEGNNTGQDKNASRSHGMPDVQVKIYHEYVKLIQEADEAEKKAVGEFVKNYEETHTNKVKQIHQEEINKTPIAIERTDGHDGHKDTQEDIDTIPIEDRSTIPVAQAEIQKGPTVTEKTIVRDRERIKYEKKLAAMEARKIALDQEITELEKKIEIELQKNSIIPKKG